MKRSGVSRRALMTLLMPAASLLLFCGENPAGVPYGESNDRIQNFTNTVMEEIAKVRELMFMRPVRAAVMSRDRFRRVVATTDWEEPSEEKEGSDLYTAMVQQLGMIRKSDSVTTIGETAGEMQGEDIAAYYKMGTDSIYVIVEGAPSRPVMDRILSDPMTEFIVAHELVHALQDQHSLLEELGRHDSEKYGLSLTTDYYMSRMALVEGDASFNELYYAFAMYRDYPDPFGQARNSAEEMAAGFLGDIAGFALERPEYLYIFFYAPYLLGPLWVSGHYGSGGGGGWSDLDWRYGNPPLSTAEIVTRSGFTPEAFDFSGLYGFFDTSGLYNEDVLGGVLSSALFRSFDQGNPDIAGSIAATYGWRGDRILFQEGNGGYGRFVWAFSFAAPADARSAYGRLCALHFPLSDDYLRPVFDSSVTDTLSASLLHSTFFSSAYRSGVVLDDRNVYWVENMGADMESVVAFLTGEALAKRSKADDPVRGRNPLFRWFLRQGAGRTYRTCRRLNAVQGTTGRARR